MTGERIAISDIGQPVTVDVHEFLTEWTGVVSRIKIDETGDYVTVEIRSDRSVREELERLQSWIDAARIESQP